MEQVTENIFNVVIKTEGKGKNKTSIVLVETSIKGYVYKSEVYIDSHLVDAKEVSCQDLATAEDGEVVFKERYISEHEKFKDLYLAPRVFVKVLSSEGKYIEDEDAQCSISTSIYENIVRHEVFVDGTEIDVIENYVEKELSLNKLSFANKYKQFHKEVEENYFKIDKFPTNTMLNPILKKYPFYKTKPMYSLYLFIASVVFVLWVLSMILCGKALKKIVVKVAGKEAGLIVKDFQKSMCIKGGGEEVVLEDEKLSQSKIDEILAKYGSKYTVIPKKVNFKSTKEVRPIYFKNNMGTDVIVKLRDRIIVDFKDPLVTPDMIVNILTPLTIYIKGDEIGTFEFKIEDEFLKKSSIANQNFSGTLLFDIIDVKDKKTKAMPVNFYFESSLVTKDK